MILCLNQQHFHSALQSYLPNLTLLLQHSAYFTTRTLPRALLRPSVPLRMYTTLLYRRDSSFYTVPFALLLYFVFVLPYLLSLALLILLVYNAGRSLYHIYILFQLRPIRSCFVFCLCVFFNFFSFFAWSVTATQYQFFIPPFTHQQPCYTAVLMRVPRDHH